LILPENIVRKIPYLVNGKSIRRRLADIDKILYYF